jgi:hypothetical protein
MAQTKTYKGGCHCGQVQYEATTDLSQVISCNCSICSKRGLLLTFVTPDQFALHAGAQGLTDYQFNKKVIHHKFCDVCGVASFAEGKKPDGKTMFAINVRCLDGVDVSSLTVTPVDGKNF